MLPVWGFVAVTVPLVLSPGVSTAVVLRNSVAGGVRAGLQTAVGANVGSLCYGLLAAAGVSLALQRWPSAWLALRIGGTLYIAWLGLQSLWRVADGGRPAGRVWRRGAGAERPRQHLRRVRHQLPEPGYRHLLPGHPAAVRAARYTRGPQHPDPDGNSRRAGGELARRLGPGRRNAGARAIPATAAPAAGT